MKHFQQRLAPSTFIFLQTSIFHVKFHHWNIVFTEFIITPLTAEYIYQTDKPFQIFITGIISAINTQMFVQIS